MIFFVLNVENITNDEILFEKKLQKKLNSKRFVDQNFVI